MAAPEACSARLSRRGRLLRGSSVSDHKPEFSATSSIFDATNFPLACQFELNRNRGVYKHKATREGWLLFAGSTFAAAASFRQAVNSDTITEALAKRGMCAVRRLEM
jgi:hypothetical protein